MKKILMKPITDHMPKFMIDKAYAALFAFLAMSLPRRASADDGGFGYGDSLGSMMCSLSHNMAPFQNLFIGLAYIGGAVTIGSGLFHFIKHHDQIRSHEHPISRPLTRVVAGACLLALPAFLRLCINSIFRQDDGGGLSSCVAYVGYDGYGVWGGNVGLDGLMINLITNIRNPMIYMLSVLSILIGIYLVIRGLMKGAKHDTDPRANSVPNIMANIIVGTVLFTVGTSLNTVLASVFGDSSIMGPNSLLSTIAYDFGAGTLPFQQAVYAALTFFQLVGMIAFIRGWLILKDAVEGQGQKTISQGLTHIIGGVMAINIYRVLDVFDASFGTGFLS